MAARTKKELKQHLEQVYDRLMALYGPQKCYLDHFSPFQLLIATILSAQCTDKKVNSITPALFKRYPTVRAFAGADPAELEQMIHVCGFFHAKADHIIKASQKLMTDFQGNVPDTMEELTTLPGVGRKTANVVLGDSFDVPGLPVDTHVKRLSNLMGFVREEEDPAKIEAVLCGALPPERWSQFSHLLIIHGRTRCPARRPQCAQCELRELCRHGLNLKQKD